MVLLLTLALCLLSFVLAVGEPPATAYSIPHLAPSGPTGRVLDRAAPCRPNWC